ncbi:MAG: type II toxin-antitoxin system RelE/ParE family toxin [Acidobacteria bacterium]|nr:type II toxin-antitoxin system RelE/ParE family toxin [Acidobacteriota bacterium]
MAQYKIEISATAERQLKKIRREDQVRILGAVSLLARNPHPDGCRKMSGYDDVYRIRVGNYRVIYEIDGKRIVVVILKIGHRREIYR